MARPSGGSSVLADRIGRARSEGVLWPADADVRPSSLRHGAVARGSASGSAPSKHPSRHSIPSLLSGVSSSAEYLNSKQDQSFRLLVEGKFASVPSSPLLVDRRKTMHASPELDEQDFVRDTERLVLSISDLRSRHEAFETSGSPLARKVRGTLLGGGPYSSGKATDISQEDQERNERLAERLDAYKMVRKVEGELPPLTPLSSLPKIGKKVADETIIRRNASSQVIQCSSPAARREHLAFRKEELGARLVTAASTREEMVAALCKEYSEDLRRKRQQGEKAIAERKESSKKATRRSALAEQWLTFHAIASFARQVHEEVKVGRMPTHERMQYVEKQAQGSSKRSRKASHFVLQAMFINAVMQDEEAVARFRLLSDMSRNRFRVREARVSACAIHSCLTSWQVAGRCFIAFKTLFNRVVMVQRWWRECAARLREIRDRISKRWERLERTALASELNKATPLPTRPGKSPTSPKLPLEERIQLETVEEAVRIRFIERELRARRYRLLPAIEIWKEEVLKWREECRDRAETRDAHKALGAEAPPMKIFHWPPVRPSYLPKAHFRTEVRGGPCHEGCLGRQGDEEILCMWRAARRDPHCEGITVLPCRGGSSSAVSKQRKPNDAAEAMSESTRPFGDAPDEELTEWGVDPTALPGLSSGDADGDSAIS